MRSDIQILAMANAHPSQLEWRMARKRQITAMFNQWLMKDFSPFHGLTSCVVLKWNANWKAFKWFHAFLFLLHLSTCMSGNESDVFVGCFQENILQTILFNCLLVLHNCLHSLHCAYSCVNMTNALIFVV